MNIISTKRKWGCLNCTFGAKPRPWRKRQRTVLKLLIIPHINRMPWTTSSTFLHNGSSSSDITASEKTTGRIFIQCLGEPIDMPLSKNWLIRHWRTLIEIEEIITGNEDLLSHATLSSSWIEFNVFLIQIDQPNCFCHSQPFERAILCTFWKCFFEVKTCIIDSESVDCNV